MNKVEPVVVIHGGAWAIPENISDASRNGVKLAAKKSYDILKHGGSALDAVEAAVVILEDEPVFDAGKGSCLNAAGLIEMDASIMDGTSLKAGAVAAVANISNPICLARMVMEQTDHCLLVGEGANMFANECNVPSVDPSSLVTEACLDEWQTFEKYKSAVDSLFNNQINALPLGHDTVGAVAMDANGRIAAATSTGGITGKRVGRVGDSPLIGSGTYAIDEIGGVSCTGHGESIIKICLAKHIICLMESGMKAQEAVEQSLQLMNSRVKGAGGAICISASGEPAFHFTTERMAWAIAKADVLSWGLDPNECNIEKMA
ncbi:isoaspartyl peptidase/L-asparaginase-like [Daphnia carinata]|uniref:isoaspartyl peptidase/L-asparaginase-like n=1 Tax=Daphnia carinata TaxID=120202 RepID=UPI00257DA1ED|nr:isoaspartyl peptidase/L-asparaginase-like [Daphnia carinata]